MHLNLQMYSLISTVVNNSWKWKTIIIIPRRRITIPTAPSKNVCATALLKHYFKILFSMKLKAKY